MRSGPGKNEQEPKKKKYSGQQQKEMDCHEPHPAPNEKTQPIQWTERPTGALVAVNSLWPRYHRVKTNQAKGRGGEMVAVQFVPTAINFVGRFSIFWI